ncbi:AIPR family protein [Nioella sp. MMSF_3534]|uniref:AIPR family protein n=1 Tax=Nioella sp. MMSF_3534 TaxID=3046720 RepID=UPI00273EF79C|nr:AIPR family protein [Nioella sp. MMSF_3534]
MKSEELEYAALLPILSRYSPKGRTESANFLNWFLENIYRLDETTADDCICDKENDKGIDGIYVDDNASEILFFQAKISQKANRTLGDKVIKEFLGSLQQFETSEKIEIILLGQANDDLKRILTRNNVAGLIEKGYSVKGIFLCNSERDDNTLEIEKVIENISIFCASDIAESFVDFDADEGVDGNFSFDTSYAGVVNLHIDAETEVFLLPVSAMQLVKLSGIHDGVLFSQNVRYSLGNTAVNRSISKSVADKDEHKNFALYHNGITLICQNAIHEDETLTVSNYVVVNGAQSISTFYKNSANLTPDLRVFVKVVALKSSELSRKITINSNNQNSIKPRDLRSNHDLMLRLRAEFESKQDEYVFVIKRGQETDENKIAISNELAGRELLAFDLHESNLCHQIGKVFDDRYAEIFGRHEVTFGRIIFTHELQKLVSEALEKLENKAMANYSLTRYFLLSVLGQIIRKFPEGREFLANTDKLNSTDDRKKVLEKIPELLIDLIVDLNYELRAKDHAFDYKRELKSTTEIKSLTALLLQSYEKEYHKGKAIGFGEKLG